MSPLGGGGEVAECWGAVGGGDYVAGEGGSVRELPEMKKDQRRRKGLDCNTCMLIVPREPLTLISY